MDDDDDDSKRKKNFQLFFIVVIIVFSFPNHSKSIMFYSQKRKNSAYFSIQFFKFNHLLLFSFFSYEILKKKIFIILSLSNYFYPHTHTHRELSIVNSIVEIGFHSES